MNHSRIPNADLISRSALLGVIDAAFFATDPTGEEQLGFLKCRRFVREAPTIDAVEVVRCKDCVHYHPCNLIECSKLTLDVEADFFCAYGERNMDAEVEG